MERKNRLVTREQLLREVWNIDFDSETSVLDTYMSYLRERSTMTTSLPSPPCAASDSSWLTGKHEVVKLATRLTILLIVITTVVALSVGWYAVNSSTRSPITP